MNRKTTGWLPVALAVATVILTGCTSLVRIGPNNDIKEYEGDGSLNLLSRHYGPGMETHGYILELPVFTPATDFEKQYSLSGLPRWERTAHVEIVTFLPKTRMHDWEAAKLAPALPPEHRLSCTLLDKETGKIIAEHKAKLADLGKTHTLYFMRASFVKHILSFDLQKLSSTENLVLKISYDDGGHRTEGEMCVTVIVDAPTA